jgi:signal transduction histidine kinase
VAERRARSLRARITVLATLAVGITLVIGALAFYGVLALSIRDTAARTAEARATDIAARIETEGLGAVDRLEDEVVQVVDASGRVVARSEDADAGDLPVTEDAQEITYDDEPLLVVSEELDDDSHIVVGISVDDARSTLGTVALLLAFAVPVIAALVAGTTWWVVGRALRPVSRIRSEVDEITGESLDRRVQVPQTGDEIAALATTMNRMLDRLDAAATAQRRFVSDASHELRSPLATVRQHAELARSHPEVTSIDDLADVVHHEGLRMQDLVDALLLLARLDEHAPMSRRSVDLDDLALAEVRRLRTAGMAVDATGIGAGRIAGDERLVGQLLRNLADNAARHAKSRVAISLVSSDGRVALTVEDDGQGVPVEDRERIFERFVRLDDARARDEGGSGLGLAIVRAIADAEGGRVSVDASPLGGARFTVTLPAAS